MKDLLKTALIIALAFASTFFIVRALNLFPENGIVAWLESLRAVHIGWLVAGVVALLLLDLLIAVPTMATILMAGWLLGPYWGGAAAALGLMMMGAFGYIIGRSAGRPVLLRMLKDEGRLADIETAFGRNDVLTLAVCQALPILPELSAVLAGIARMAPLRFALAWVLGSIPYAFILAYAGSVSSADNLRPAILAAIGITALLVLIWSRLLRPSAR